MTQYGCYRTVVVTCQSAHTKHIKHGLIVILLYFVTVIVTTHSFGDDTVILYVLLKALLPVCMKYIESQVANIAQAECCICH